MKCPKCSSTEILTISGSSHRGDGSAIPTGLTVLSAVKISRYICEKCGFTEEWVEEHEKNIEALKNKYAK